MLRIPLLCLATICLPAQYQNWSQFGGTNNIHYSSLRQINRQNVSRLQQIWSFDTGDSFAGSEMQCNPIIGDGVMFATTPKLKVIALDAATGQLRWTFDPWAGGEAKSRQRNRGVTWWKNPDPKSKEPARIFFTVGEKLYALDAATGKPIPAFGQKGWIDLRDGLGRDKELLNISTTTPGVIHRDVIILGSICGEALPSAPGDIRAYDIRTGRQRWTFHTIPHPGEAGYETWPKDGWQYLGGANNWAGMVLDAARDIVFIPTGSAAFDFYGANRHGDNLYANCLLALRASTGQKLWHFQYVRHDVWDRDFPSAPALVQVKRNGRLIDAVAQITKDGHVLLLEREAGSSIFPMKTVAAPPSPVEGEALSSTQVLPTMPAPFARQRLTADELTTRTPEAARMVRERFATLRSDGQFTPPSREGSIVFPGFDGGGEWGGAAFDPETRIFYVNSNEMAWVLRLTPNMGDAGVTNARKAYVQNCAGCHKEDLSGTPPEFPALNNLSAKYNREELLNILKKGLGRMPGFARIGDARLQSIATLLLEGENKEVLADKRPGSADPRMDLKYGIDGYNKFLDPDGYPAIKPPWGTLNAIQLDEGRYVWKIPFGEHPALVKQGLQDTGSENYGGGIVTAGGLFFIAATNFDRKLRAYDKANGRLLWETLLPVSGNATPAMFEVKGKQYLVIGAGGGKGGAPSGGTYHAFALPD
jgi:quinoprotein glucose dehydrogenase